MVDMSKFSHVCMEWTAFALFMNAYVVLWWKQELSFASKLILIYMLKKARRSDNKNISHTKFN